MIDTLARFPFLSSSFHLSYYFTRRSGLNDGVSESLLKFKDNEYPDTERWINLASKELPKVISGIDVILRVLGSYEVDANDACTSLDELCESLELEFEGSEYMTNVLKKKEYTSELKFMSRHDRILELEDIYYIDNSDSLEGKTILLVDDILTTGSTLKSIMKSLEEQVSDFNLHFFTLGKTYDDRRDVVANNQNIESDILTGALDDDFKDGGYLSDFEDEDAHLREDERLAELERRRQEELSKNLKRKDILDSLESKKLTSKWTFERENFLDKIRKNNPSPYTDPELHRKITEWTNIDLDKYKIPEPPVYRPKPTSNEERNFGCIIVILIAVFYAIILNNC